MLPHINSEMALRQVRNKYSDADTTITPLATRPAASIATILKAFGSSIDDDSPRTTMREPGSDWSMLIDRIRLSASRVREVEAQARERELEFDKMVERFRADMGVAEERVRAAEAKASQAEAAAAERIRSLEERARIAEDRARACEAWLRQVHDTIVDEFSIPDEVQG